ncbi:MAG: hypothetical protein KKA28_11585 [Planctomycetes bacterium]|nr:hypothetical protein [Planctomycetota bacterium]MCG2683770.1 hypothetical protein [Planctomycetales bacterium]
MKTTPNAPVGCTAFTMVFWAVTAAAGVPDCTLAARLGAAALEQSASAENDSKDKNRQAADLLHRARQAMAENDLSAADALISKAEALDVRYGRFYMGDTPQKARRDLERTRNSAGALPIKPSKLFSPFGLNKKKQAPSSDPFTGHAVEKSTPAAGAGKVTPLPTVESTQVRSPSAEGSSPMQPPPGRPYPITQPGENDARAPGADRTANGNPLREARLALAVGDVRRAAEFVRQARAMQVNYRPLDDTPEKVETAIRKYSELSGLDKSTEAYARAYARNLMEQADALARWSEYDEASRLADRAAGMRITYSPFEQKPQDLLGRIAAARKQVAGRPIAAAASEPGFASASAPPANVATRRQAVELVRQAREAIAAGDLDRAESLARRADALRLPDSAFAPDEDRPGLVLLDLALLRQRGDSRVVPAGGECVVPAAGAEGPDRNATHALYDTNNDPTRNVPAADQQPTYPSDRRWAQNPGQYEPSPARPPAPPTPGAAAVPQTPGMALFQQGENALKNHDATRAYEFFRQAAQYPNDLDPVTAQRLQDHLQLLSAPSRAGAPRANQALTMVDEAAMRQQLLYRRVAADLAHRESNARAMQNSDPNGALLLLEEARKKVESAGLDGTARDQLLRRVDRAVAETKQVIEKNRPQLDLAEKNKRVRQEVERGQRVKVEVQEKLAMLIDQFNRLMDEQRFDEAQVVAKRAAELDPENPVVVQVLLNAKLVNNLMRAKSIQSQKEEGFVDTLEQVDIASIPFSGKNPMVFPDIKDWKDMIGRRKKFAGDRGRPRTEREIEIEKKLRAPVSLQFTGAPLSTVLDYLAKLAEVNVHLDPQGLAEEGVTTDTPVTIELRKEIMLKSALNLILQPLHLSYVIKDEVLKITSEQMRDGEVYTRTYNVADLVIPIPNFVPTRMGLGAAYDGAMSNVGFGGSVPFGSATATPLAVVASRDGGRNGAAIDPNLLAQIGSGSRSGLPAASQGSPVGPGPGGLGGGAQADFDSLIDLITSTVRPTTWDEVGGPGTIAPFETNLSIVVSQTQDVHEELADLLEQLRRLQDLQVTIEVRFITLNDNFFERIGVDFDFDLNDNIDGKGVQFGARNSAGYVSNPPDFTVGQGVPRDVTDRDSSRTVTVGMSAPGMFNADLDIPFTQGSYTLAVPQFGGFDATAGAQLGFAILSDLEAYFFISAAQGDRRSNVLQAPKVTLFNGQQAMVADQSQSPFVISVIPVVGDFAAAQQPVIVVLSEGTFMTVQAVVSADRRFVRLTVVPFFSTIGEVNTFQFTGTQTTTTDTTRSGLQSAATDPAKLWNSKDDSKTTTNTGTTVQLPTFSIVTVATTVSVPDGGTVLLGGIKRLSEGRNEFGTPMLNKLPYINRLFKNVGIGRETQSLMMMVTPRIIIQEEEEEKLGIQTP